MRPERFYIGLCQRLLFLLVHSGVNDGEWRGMVTFEDDEPCFQVDEAITCSVFHR